MDADPEGDGVSDPLQVEMVAADRVVWSGEATMVSARTAEGDIGILSNHAPILSVMVPWPVEIRPVEGSRVWAAVGQGFLSVARNRVSILAEYIQLADDIDTAVAQHELEEAQQADRSDPDVKHAIQYAEARIRTAELAH
jgi:F-type H+-transporting ATPase subunit epsilon